MSTTAPVAPTPHVLDGVSVMVQSKELRYSVCVMRDVGGVMEYACAPTTYTNAWDVAKATLECLRELLK